MSECRFFQEQSKVLVDRQHHKILGTIMQKVALLQPKGHKNWNVWRSADFL